MPSPGKPTSIRIDPVLYGGLQELVREKRQRSRGTTIKGELEEAIRQHLTAEQSQLASPTLAPAIEAVLDERLTRLEHRLAGLLAKTGLDAATGLYVLLYTIDQANQILQAVQPDDHNLIDVQQWYEQARARAIRHFRERDSALVQQLATNWRGGD